MSEILKAEGFAKLPRRQDEERPSKPRPTAADIADVRELDLSPRSFRTSFGGLFLFVPFLAEIPLEEEVIFDSKLTTYKNLNVLNKMGIKFITLRRRSKNMLEAINRMPRSAWRRIQLDGVSRIYKTPRILEEKITLSNYNGELKQITVADLGHEEPTILITNYLRCSATKLIERYAKRMLIENGIADGIDFFHMDALSSAVAMKVDLDLQLTLMAGSLYRFLGVKLGNGYETVKSRHIFRDFIDAAAHVIISEAEIQVRFQKRAHNPLLLAADFDKIAVRIPWLGGKLLRLCFG